MAHAAPGRLDEDLLRWGRVLTHVHTVGNSACSGQQTVPEVARMAAALGYDGVVLNEHSGVPQAPYRLDPNGPELNLLRDHAGDVERTRSYLGYDIRFGLECNTVPVVKPEGTSYMLDTPLETLNASYVIGSLHGDGGNYRSPKALMTAIEMLCADPLVDTLGHITRDVAQTPINWGEVANLASATGTMIELNLNQWFKDMGQNQPKTDDSSSGVFWRRFLEQVVTSLAMPIIGADIHNAGMWPTSHLTEGWETSTDRIRDFFDLLSDCGFQPSQMAGSTVQRFDEILKTPKANRPQLAV